MADRYYRGYRVKVSSFRSGSGWRTEVSICSMKDTASVLKLPSPPLRWWAGTEQEADAYGFEMARAWIANTDE
jgi:hypothetical protein